MRNRITIITTVLLSLAACNQEDFSPESNQSDKGMIFTSDYEVTRALNTRNTFTEGDKVGILGYCWDREHGHITTEWDTKKTNCLPTVFYNQELSFSDGIWSYLWDGQSDNDMNLTPIGNLQPWLDDPNSLYTFFAYYPYANVTGPEYNSDEKGSYYEGNIRIDSKVMGTIRLTGKENNNYNTGDPTITYTMPHSGDTENSPLQWDIVPDLMLAHAIDHKPGNAVKLHFEHLFCAMEFRVNNYTDKEVNITSLSFKGTGFHKSISQTGTEDYIVEDKNTYSGIFNLVGENGEELVCPPATIDEQGNTKPSTVSVKDGEDIINLFFITGHDGKITTSTDGCSLTIKEPDQDSRILPIAKNTNFQPGVRNIFNINYIGNDVILQITSTDNWEEGGDSYIEFE